MEFPQFSPMSVQAALQVNPLSLAFVGDAVQALYVKSGLVRTCDASSHVLQRMSVADLCCEAQARAARELLSELTEQERTVYQRGRNAKVNTVPKHADPADYHAATAMEAVLGFLYLTGQWGRAQELMARMRAICAGETEKSRN